MKTITNFVKTVDHFVACFPKMENFHTFN